MPFDTTTTLASPTGAKLNLYVRPADTPARAVVQINHGLAEHGARYARFADFLAARGCHVYAHDHRGHGATTAPDAPKGRFAGKNGFDIVVADIAAIHDHIAGKHPDLQVVVFGHSMGGLIALNFVLRHSERVAAAAIWNANFSAGILGRLAQAILAFERFRLGSDVPSRMLPKLTFGDWARKIPNRRTEFDWLSRDVSEVDAYVADPLCGWDASVSMWIDVFDLVFAGADDGNFAGVRRDLPFNLVGGQRDPATDGGKAVEALAGRLRRMGFSNLVSKVYPETRHESLNEINREPIMADFAGWLDRTLPR
ncbi:alpha/beta hydrolase [Aminobacter sp. SR38]|jgi:alpha-beta hydrolase superfamily lysophospholipase|uniref:alpha/beta fold hydrolase n=1 Tax=Aminobacter sp. SR38 TaxID=2774562 RepID=UPI0017822D07|nr:alpha/beta hydrolase [Aminobacter sp. SR38]QOF70934.1 alpha/beta hydrolase [Aminobacter sp. SR38]